MRRTSFWQLVALCLSLVLASWNPADLRRNLLERRQANTRVATNTTTGNTATPTQPPTTVRTTAPQTTNPTTTGANTAATRAPTRDTNTGGQQQTQPQTTTTETNDDDTNTNTNTGATTAAPPATTEPTDSTTATTRTGSQPAVNTGVPSTSNTVGSSTRRTSTAAPASTQPSSQSAVSTSSDDTTGQTSTQRPTRTTNGGPSATIIDVLTLTTVVTDGGSTVPTTLSRTVVRVGNVTGSSIAEVTAALNAASQSNQDAGLSASNKRIIIGVVAGVGGFVVLAAFGSLLYRLFRRHNQTKFAEVSGNNSTNGVDDDGNTLTPGYEEAVGGNQPPPTKTRTKFGISHNF